ncbi:hypothetical protein BCR42DRAFT_401741 [Absidia repens]|uniref:Uncharacterized protein n=1 Tax=Absidia repens TaxID=90262 RepID=A0A1X2J4M3_9FUNG|nr:hypothetical protein BCR42DRAFT_401741 [Absidia repens]
MSRSSILDSIRHKKKPSSRMRHRPTKMAELSRTASFYIPIFGSSHSPFILSFSILFPLIKQCFPVAQLKTVLQPFYLYSLYKTKL